jgi:hypothetical protein
MNAMAMDANETRLLEQTVEALGALTFVLRATLQVLNKDVSNLKPRLRTMLSTVSAHALASTAGDTAPMIKTAGDFIDAI